MSIKTKHLIFAVILVVVAGLGGFKYYQSCQELSGARLKLRGQENSVRIVSFAKLFIQDVLKADKEVNFDTRLKLENAVRDLGDAEILSQWQKFTDSKTETEAQQEVKNLLGLLINKMAENQKVLRQ